MIGKRNRKGGLTLIEVLLAAAFLSLALVTMLTAISRCLWVFKASANYHKVLWALSAGEVEHPLVRTMKNDDTEPDDYEVGAEDYDGITYERTVEDPYKDEEDSEVRLIIIKTKLSWEGLRKERTEEIAHYVLFREK